jgi:hypothetical protein
MVSQNSRYSKNGTLVLTLPDGQESWYFRRRFIPDTSRDPVLTLHTVSQNERPDIIAANYLGDPEQFWRLCDANMAVRPDDLTKTIGKRIKIPSITRG